MKKRKNSTIYIMGVMALVTGMTIIFYSNNWHSPNGANIFNNALKWVITGVGLLFYIVSATLAIISMKKKYRYDDEYIKTIAHKSAYITLIVAIYLIAFYVMGAVFFSSLNTVYIFDANDVYTTYLTTDHVAVLMGGVVIIQMLIFFTYSLSTFILKRKGNIEDYAE